MDADRDSTGAIEVPHPYLVCPYCGGQGPRATGRVRIVDISQVANGWVAHGDLLRFLSDAPRDDSSNPVCWGCAQVYREMTYHIPIECSSFPCPGCGPSSKLTTEILSITESDSGYSFVALLKCDACSKQRRFSKLFRGLSKITRIKVGPTGVEVEVKS